MGYTNPSNHPGMDRNIRRDQLGSGKTIITWERSWDTYPILAIANSHPITTIL